MFIDLRDYCCEIPGRDMTTCMRIAGLGDCTAPFEYVYRKEMISISIGTIGRV